MKTITKDFIKNQLATNPTWAVKALKTGAFKGVPVSADTSRAMPYTLKQCAKLGVSLSVNKVSSSFK